MFTEAKECWTSCCYVDEKVSSIRARVGRGKRTTTSEGKDGCSGVCVGDASKAGFSHRLLKIGNP